MSLRYQINLRILFSSLCILIMGGSIAIGQARDAVNKEIASSINLAVQLIGFGLSQASPTPFDQTDWPKHFHSLTQTRHLSVQLKEPSGRVIDFAKHSRRSEQNNEPPRWFVDLVGADYPPVEHSITRFNGERITLMIQANPLDEITEVWQETLGFFGSLFLLTLLTFLAVNLAFDKALKSIAVIVNALKTIETGNYRQRLPDFSIHEYDAIAKAINHMTGELDAGRQENRALTQHTLAIQEDERQRLSQELHDELGQSLTAIKVMAVAAGHGQSGDIKQATDTIVTTTEHLMTVVRSMMHQLHPLVLTDLGLKAALEDLTHHWSLRNPGLKLSVDCSDAADRLNRHVTIQVFRVVQECLTNIVRHADADHASIKLAVEERSETGKTLCLRVTDDGQGCDSGRIKTGFGLLGMRERIVSLGGELTILTEPNQGMQLIATVPLGICGDKNRRNIEWR